MSGFDTTIWRELGAPGAPLVSGAGAGPLAGRTVAVKDLFAVAGHAIGAGVPAFLAEREAEPATAPAVTALLDAGADVVGIARTDEFAYSIAGRNPHYGTPPNPAVPGGLPGGSSNGPAAAVATGAADLGLGTDTGGSIRVPASYQGLWGLRTTHGAVPRDGLLPLAPSFDTVGWLAREPVLLADAARVSLTGSPQHAGDVRFAIVELGAHTLAPGLDRAFRHRVDDMISAGFDIDASLDAGDPAELHEAFRVLQSWEAWRSHGDWITAHPGALGDEIAARFETARGITPEQAHAARAAVAAHRDRIEALAEGRVLLLPSASSAAPAADAAGPEVEAARTATLRLTAIGGITGRPAVSAPLLTVPGGPVGLCFIGVRGTDVALVELAASVAAKLG